MRILLVVDADNWAFAHKARAIKRYLPQHDIEIKRYVHYKESDLARYNHVHFFSTLNAPRSPRATASVTSHNYRLKRWEETQRLFPPLTALSCVSRQIYDDLQETNLNKTLYLCMNGVDEKKFYSKKRNASKPFRVLWVGAQKYLPLPGKNIDTKGCCLLDILRKKLSQYRDIQFTVHNNSHKNAVPHERMIDLYNTHDLLLCLSAYEGTPNPVFEASACGLPIVSTPVGCVPEFLVDEVNGLLLPSYRNLHEGYQMIDACVEKIQFLKNNREIGRDMGAKGREEIETNWTWEIRAQYWNTVFENHQQNISKG